MTETKKLLEKIYPFAVIIVFIGLAFFLSSQTKEDSIATNKDSMRSAKEALESCREIQHKENCYAKYFENLTTATNRDYAFETLRTLQTLDTQARGCHFIAHAISSAETQKDVSNWKKLLNTAPPDCSYGAAHGVLEAYAAITFPDGKIPESIIPTLCDNPDKNNCTHGLGHLLLVETKDNIPKALALCEKLPHNNLGKFECITGVFMERITALNLEIHGLVGPEALNWSARLGELEVLCREQTNPVYSHACWKEIVHVALVKFRNNPQMLVDFCETAPREDSIRGCIDHALGIMAAGYNFELSRMKPMCDTRVKASDFKDRCYAHLVSATIATIPQEIPSAVKFCSSLESSYQTSCFTMIGNSLYGANPDRKAVLAKECTKAPTAMQTRCVQGGPSTVPFYTGD